MPENLPFRKEKTLLYTAWEYFALFDMNSNKASVKYLFIQKAVIFLFILITSLAILSTNQSFDDSIIDALNLALILFPIMAVSLFSIMTNNNYQQKWLVLRLGAEEIKKNIFI